MPRMKRGLVAASLLAAVVACFFWATGDSETENGDDQRDLSPVPTLGADANPDAKHSDVASEETRSGSSAGPAPSLGAQTTTVGFRDDSEEQGTWDNAAEVRRRYLAFVRDANLSPEKDQEVRRILLDAQKEISMAEDADDDAMDNGEKQSAEVDIAESLHFETEARLRKLLSAEEFAAFKRHGNMAMTFMNVKLFAVD